jgi:hypothetical protein
MEATVQNLSTPLTASGIQISPYFFRRFPQVIRKVHSFCTSRRGFPIAGSSALPQSVGSENVSASRACWMIATEPAAISGDIPDRV